MNCPETQDRLIDLLLDEASEAERDVLQAHVAGCLACEGEKAHLEQTLQYLRDSAWGPEAGQIDAAHRERLELRAREPRARAPHWWFAAAGLAAAVIGGVWLTASRRQVELPPVWESRAELRVPPTSALPAPPRPQAKPLVPSKDQYDKLASLGYIESGVPGGVEGGVPGGVVGGVVGGSPGGAPADMYFENRRPNRAKSAAGDPLSTFGLDVDTASYTIVRNYLRRGQSPPAEAVRVEEFVNALPQDYPAPSGETFSISIEGAPDPLRPNQDILRIGLRARDVARTERKPAVLTFVIDVSGSMGMENRLGLVKRSLRLLVDKLDESDRIGIVVYGTNGRVLLEPTPVSGRWTILDAIESLAPEGSTNLEQGLDLGYEMASEAFDPAANNRVVLCTDGVANNGITDAKTLLVQIKRRAQKGIDMIALGFGMGNYNDALLQRLADEGNGQYAYINDFQAARTFFLRNLGSALEVVARDGKAQVEFDPSRVERYRLLGYEKRVLAHEDFRNDAVDGGEVNAGQTVTVLYELKLRDRGGRLGEVRVRYLDPDTREPREISKEIAEESVRSSFDEASPRFQLTVLTARFAELLRGDSWVKGQRLEQVLDRAEALPTSVRRSPEAGELMDLVKKAAHLSLPER